MEEQCLKASVNTCGDCIKSGSGCAWCKDLNFTKAGEQEAARCNTAAMLRDKGCSSNGIINPKNDFIKTKDKPLAPGANPVQIQPQEVQLNLRPGFGSFVDKTLLPYTDTNEAKLQRPCSDKSEPCQPAFGFQHVLSLTKDGTKFRDMVAKQHISGNLDPPEGSLDAIMQVAVCVKDIGWGNSTRLLVLATDDGFHMAGDGKLAAILEPNKETCELVKNKYSKSNLWDYPSVGQIARKLEEQNIQPIFAVTKKMETELSKLIPKSAVGVLSEDSSNVVKIIVDAYNNLTSEVILAHEALPDFISVKYTSDCKGGESPSERGKCDNVNIGKEVIFNVTVTVDRCITSQSFLIGPLGFSEKMRVNIRTRCECECDDSNQPHPHCGGNGKVVCGSCSCDPGFLGQRCECKLGQKDEASLKAQCRKDNGTECEGKGDCLCGRCQCYSTDSGGNFYGEFCECDDEHCEKANNTQCAGHGKCKCGKCECDQGYEGPACDCVKSDKDCMTDEGVCHERGKCECNVCKCERGYSGAKCKTCSSCQRPCKESGLLKYDCRVRDKEGCWMLFTMTEQRGFDKYYVKVLQARECPEGPNIAAIVGGSLAAVALIGLLILLIIKGVLYASDLREWKRFEKDRKHEKTSGTNPLFQNATTTIQNPTFSGDS
uniref:Integrin beta n=1 Tax=Cyprinus carpio TaxID=7962 RepID=A0A8C2ESE9_CYPCA